MASGIKHKDTGEGLEQDEMHSPNLHIITADLDVATHKIVNLLDPTQDQDAVTKHALNLLGNRYYALPDVTCIWRSWNFYVSDTPRTAAIYSISGDCISLQGSDAYRFGEWGTAPEKMHQDSVLLKIQNTTKSQFAWIRDNILPNLLYVTDAADIATWENDDIVSTSYTGPSNYVTELDLSPLIPDGATMIFLKTQCLDIGTIVYATGLQASAEGVAGTWCNTFCQVPNLLICGYPSIPVQSNRHITVRDRATGTNTLRQSTSVIAYVK